MQNGHAFGQVTAKGRAGNVSGFGVAVGKISAHKLRAFRAVQDVGFFSVLKWLTQQQAMAGTLPKDELDEILCVAVVFAGPLIGVRVVKYHGVRQGQQQVLDRADDVFNIFRVRAVKGVEKGFAQIHHQRRGVVIGSDLRDDADGFGRTKTIGLDGLDGTVFQQAAGLVVQYFRVNWMDGFGGSGVLDGQGGD